MSKKIYNILLNIQSKCPKYLNIQEGLNETATDIKNLCKNMYEQ